MDQYGLLLQAVTVKQITILLLAEQSKSISALFSVKKNRYKNLSTVIKL